jgi:hypothetical protein
MILQVPYQSQEPLETTMERRWCGIASLWMVLAFHLGDQVPTVDDLLAKYGPDFEGNGFQHKDLLKIARDLGLYGFRKSWWAEPGVQDLYAKFKGEGESEEELQAWMETNLEEGIFTLEGLIDEKCPVIVSVSREFSPSDSTHLIVVIGYEDGALIVHDPYKKGPAFRVSKEEFKRYWIRQAIIIKK